MMTDRPKIVVIGGGTGTFPVISGLKHYPVDLTCVIAVSDSGGSTGRIRDEFGFQPVGDLRQALAALASQEGEEWIRKLLLYRFEKGVGLKGHNLGNLILTALQDVTGDTGKALEIATKVFRIRGHVLPATRNNVNLLIHYEDGTEVVGEHTLDEVHANPKKIKAVRLTPNATVNPAAVTAIRQADVVVIGPGDFYASLYAALLPKGIPQAFRHSHAKVAYCVNLMTRLTQTDGMSAYDHVRGIEEIIGKSVDTIIMNNEPIPAAVAKLYAHEHEYPVEDDLGSDTRVIRQDMLNPELTKKSTYDVAHRSLLRHDPAKLSKILWKILQK